jgi:hypothetical protein
VEGQEIGITTLGGQERTGVVDDGGHYPAACCGSSSSRPISARNSRAR